MIVITNPHNYREYLARSFAILRRLNGIEITCDFNGDGFADLATANNYSDDVSKLLNQCGGSGNSTVCAGDGILVEGFGETGDYNATCGSDDSYWAAHGASLFFQISDPVVQFELTATAPAGFGGSTISVDIEASKQNANGNLNLRALLFNFTTGSYVSLPGIMPLATTDTVQNFALPVGADPTDFIAPFVISAFHAVARSESLSSFTDVHGSNAFTIGRSNQIVPPPHGR